LSIKKGWFCTSIIFLKKIHIVLENRKPKKIQIAIHKGNNILGGSLAPNIETKYQRNFISFFLFSHHTWQVSGGKMKKIEVGVFQKMKCPPTIVGISFFQNVRVL